MTTRSTRVGARVLKSLLLSALWFAGCPRAREREPKIEAAAPPPRTPQSDEQDAAPRVQEASAEPRGAPTDAVAPSGAAQEIRKITVRRSSGEGVGARIEGADHRHLGDVPSTGVWYPDDRSCEQGERLHAEPLSAEFKPSREQPCSSELEFTLPLLHPPTRMQRIRVVRRDDASFGVEALVVGVDPNGGSRTIATVPGTGLLELDEACLPHENIDVEPHYLLYTTPPPQPCAEELTFKLSYVEARRARAALALGDEKVAAGKWRDALVLYSIASEALAKVDPSTARAARERAALVLQERAAVSNLQAFQRGQQLTATGKLDRPTAAKLNLDRKSVQKELEALSPQRMLELTRRPATGVRLEQLRESLKPPRAAP